MPYTFGFIGCGNMGRALATAARKRLPGEQILLSNRTRSKAEQLAVELEAVAGSNTELARESRYLFLGVKPQMMAELLSSLSGVLQERHDRFVLVTMAAGLDIRQIRAMVGRDYPVIRIMPNTPCSIGAGLIQYAVSDNVSEEERAEFTELMGGAGVLDQVDEALMDAGSAVAGCGPAFVDLFIEALADGGVQIGLPRDKALRYAAQTVMGSAQLVLQSGKHPAQLKDEVCSPGGSTIVGVHALESLAFRSAVMDAVSSAYRRSRELGEDASSVRETPPASAPARDKGALGWLFGR